MKAPDFYLNNYIADELRAAFDKEDVCISYSGDYEPETLNQVHNSCEILFVEEGKRIRRCIRRRWHPGSGESK